MEKLSEQQIDDLVELWHSDDNAFPGVDLHDFLGWTWEGYRTWAESGVIPAQVSPPMPWSR